MTLISSIFVLLFVALVAGELLNRVGIPSVVGELLTGLILGPAVLGIVSVACILWKKVWYKEIQRYEYGYVHCQNYPPKVPSCHTITIG